MYGFEADSALVSAISALNSGSGFSNPFDRVLKISPPLHLRFEGSKLSRDLKSADDAVHPDPGGQDLPVEPLIERGSQNFSATVSAI